MASLFKILKFVAVTVSSTIVFQAHASTNEMTHHGTKTMLPHSKRTKLSQTDTAELLQVFKRNEALHAAFYSFDAKKVAQAARQMAEAMASVRNKELSKKMAFSTKTLLEMSEPGKTRAQLDQSYHLVSMALIHFLKNYDIGKDYDAYSCPMVKKKWVQNSAKKAKVHNPYAPGMPHCGSQDTKFKS